MKRLALAALLVPCLLASASAADEPAPPPLVHEVVLHASPRAVWDVFATEEGWKSLGVAKAKVDFRVGGKVLTHYRADGVLGDAGTIENTILAFEPERVLAFRATKAPAGFPFPKEAMERTWSVVDVRDLGDGRTRLTLKGLGYGTDADSAKMREFFDKGNASTLALLAKRFPAPASDPATAPIEASARVEAPPAEVFRTLTTSEGVTGYLGVAARVELAIGGAYELEFLKDAPKGQRGSEGCTVQAWLPGRMLSYTWNAPPKYAHAREQRTLVVIEMEPDGPGATRVRVTHHGFDAKAKAEPDHAEEWKAVRAYFSAAWPNVLKALAARFAPK